MQNPKIEFASKEEIKLFQEEKLRDAINYAYQNSPFYASLFKQHQISPEEIHTLEDLKKIPVTTKEHLQRKNKEFYAVERKRIVDYCNTSGTLGSPVNIPLTDSDLERLAYNEALSFMCAGGNENELYQLTTTIDKRFMAGLAYFLGARKLGAGFVRVGPGIPEMQWKTIFDLKPTALIAVPSFLLKLLEYADKYGIDHQTTPIKKAICIGEPVRTPSFELNALGKRIKELWDIELYSTYASTEMATAFTECNSFQGGHHQPELIIAEFLDDNNEEVPEGEPGELTITTLGVEALPLLRFKTGDITVKHTEKCACGRTTFRIGPVIGRKQQMIKYKGTTLFPPAIFDVIDHIPDINAYVVEVYSNEYNNDEIKVRLNAKEGFSNEMLTNKFRSSLKVLPEVEYLSKEEIKAIMFPEHSRKPVKFIDKRG